MDPLPRSLAVLFGELILIVLLGVLVDVAFGRLLGLFFDPGPEGKGAAFVASTRRFVRRILFLSLAVAAVAVTALDVWLIARGQDVWAFTLEQLQSVTPEVWREIGIRAGQVVALLVGAVLGLRLLRRLLAAAEEGARGWKHLESNEEAIGRFFASLCRISEQATWLGVVVLAAQIVGLPAGVALWLFVALKVYVILSAGVLFWRSMDMVIDTLDALSRQLSAQKDVLDYYERLHHLIPVARRALEYVIYVTVASLAVQQIEAVADLAEWGPRLARIIGIVFLSRVVVSLLHLGTDELLVNRAHLDETGKARRMTLAPLLRSGEKYVVYFFAVVFVLEEVGVDPMPVLAGAGIVGLAVGFGAQALVRDVVTGLFILFEHYFLVGDFVRIGDIEGFVEAIDLRTTRIRDAHGSLHILPNGDVQHIVHMSNEHAIAVVDVSVAYESDLALVEETLARVGRELAEANPSVREATQVLGLQAFGESDLVFRTATKVAPAKQYPVSRDLRRRVKLAFDAAGIEIPYAKRVVMMQVADDAVADEGAPA